PPRERAVAEIGGDRDPEQRGREPRTSVQDRRREQRSRQQTQGREAVGRGGPATPVGREDAAGGHRPARYQSGRGPSGARPAAAREARFDAGARAPKWTRGALAWAGFAARVRPLARSAAERRTSADRARTEDGRSRQVARCGRGNRGGRGVRGAARIAAAL